MNFFKEYIDHLKDNKEGYWFKKKLYGWGWTPATWQGWLTILIYVVLLVLASVTFKKSYQEGDFIFAFISPVILITAAFIFVAYIKGEKPGWQWGKDKKEEKKD